jgi:hypothetical protein
VSSEYLLKVDFLSGAFAIVPTISRVLVLWVFGMWILSIFLKVDFLQGTSSIGDSPNT